MKGRHVGVVLVVGNATLALTAVGALGAEQMWLSPSRLFSTSSPFVVEEPIPVAAALNARGDAVAVVMPYTLDRIGVRTRIGVRGRWSDTRWVAPSSYGAGYRPLGAAVNRAGEAAVSYAAKDGVYVVRRVGGIWGRPARVIATSERGVARVTLSHRGMARVVAVTRDVNGDRCAHTAVLFEQATPGARWNLAGAPLQMCVANADRVVRTSRSGDVLVVWRDPAGVVNASRRHASEAEFERPRQLGTGQRSVEGAIADDGSATVAWETGDIDGDGKVHVRGVSAAIRSPDGAFSEPSTVGAVQTPNTMELGPVAVDRGGAAVIPWIVTADTVPARVSVALLRSTDQAWQAPIVLRTPDDGGSVTPAFIVATRIDAGVVQVVWDRVTVGDRQGSRIATRRPDGTWKIVDLGDAPSVSAVASAPDGRAIFLRTDFALRNYDAVTTPRTGRVTVLGVRTSDGVSARVATDRPGRIFVAVLGPPGHVEASVATPPRRPGAYTVRLGALSAGSYRLRAVTCNRSLGCSSARSVPIVVR